MEEEVEVVYDGGGDDDEDGNDVCGVCGDDGGDDVLLQQNQIHKQTRKLQLQVRCQKAGSSYCTRAIPGCLASFVGCLKQRFANFIFRRICD